MNISPTLTFLLFSLSARAATACATCFGAADSPQTKAANMAILFLLAVVVAVLGGVATFFLRLLRNEAPLEEAEHE